MDEDKEVNDQHNRREFLKKGLLTGGALALTSSFLTSCSGNKKSGEKVKVLTTDGKIIEVDRSEVELQEQNDSVNSHVREGVPNRKFVMVIDLSRCKNARKCIESCSEMHGLPANKSFIRVNQMQDAPETAPYWMPLLCSHCDNPPCVKVCPVDATFKLSDGIVGIDNERCIGCRFCMVACPYSSRTFNWEEPPLLLKDEADNGTKHTCVDRKIGTVEKCDFCPSMIRENLLPSCVTACPYGVYYFGDENEDTVTNGSETVRLSQLLKDKAGYRNMEDLGTNPRIYYLPAANRQFPFEDGLPDKSNQKS